MKENWNDFFDMLIGHEGGFTDDIHDNGNKKGDGHGNEGSTMWGVTAWNWAHHTGKPAPKEVMKALKKEDVEEFYKKRYWDAVSGDSLQSGVDVSICDLCVNAGPKQAAKLLQRIAGVTADGSIGPMTLKAVHDMDSKDILHKYYDSREHFYRNLPDYDRYGRGWSRRNKETLEKALELVNE
jgi:lysozyme family protein